VVGGVIQFTSSFMVSHSVFSANHELSLLVTSSHSFTFLVLFGKHLLLLSSKLVVFL